MRALLVLLTASLLAGCVGEGGLLSSSTQVGADARLAALDPTPVTPTGATKEFTLYLHPMAHEPYPQASMQMWGFSLSDDPSTVSVPGPEIRVTEGDLVRVTFRSLVANFPHTIHFHGQHVPWDMDGVPYLSQEPIEAGSEFTYEFVATPSGTYWYHCHFDSQHHLDMGMYGAFIVEPQDRAQDPSFSREYTMILDEMDRFHLEGGNPNPENTPQSGDPYQYRDWAERTTRDVSTRNQQVDERVTGTPLRPTRDWYPVTLAPYTADYNTFVVNGHSFPWTEPLMISNGEVVRVRLINAGNEAHAMHLHGHHFLVTHKDGILLASPYLADTILIAPGERYDLYVKGTNPGVWDFHDHMTQTNQNDEIWPGGMMTMMVYEQFADKIADHGGHGGKDRSGQWLRHYFLP